jgi:hypothetical protein
MALSKVDPNFVNVSQYGRRNLIINGAMVIDQRNGGDSITITNTVAYTYTIDRWGAYTYPTGSKFSVQQNAGSVTPPAGFTKYLGATSLSAHSIGSSDIHIFRQAIEGFNVADLGWGSANAKSVTLSFWVRSSLTGAFGGSFNNGGFNRSYPFSYTISDANTWEQKKITISGDTSGSWETDNTLGINLNLSLGVGSSYSGTAGSWASADYRSSTGTTSVVGTNGATFYVTGVQLEVGSTATPFEHRSYGEELQLCKRYFQIHGNEQTTYRYLAAGFCNSTSQAQGVLPLPVTMRTAPTTTVSGNWQLINGSAGPSISLSTKQLNASSIGLEASGSGFTLNSGAIFRDSNDATASVKLDAEL